MMNLSEIFFDLGIQNPTLFYAVGFIAVLVTALSKAGFGGAIAIGIPILLLVTTPRVALGVTLPILLTIDLWVVRSSYKKVNSQLLFIMLLFGLIGHGVGWFYFDHISGDLLTAFIGFMSLLTVFLYFKKRWLPEKIITPKKESVFSVWLRGSLWCSIAGVSSFVSTSGGVPLQVFLLRCKIDRSVYIGSAAAFFLALNLTKIPLYADLNILSYESFIISMMLVPAIPFGIILAGWVNRFLSDEKFYLWMHIILGVVGLQLLYRVFV